MNKNLTVTAGKGKSKKQAVQGVQVFQQGNEFLFNYQTVNQPRDVEIEFLKLFRNKFVDELEQLNRVLENLPD